MNSSSDTSRVQKKKKKTYMELETQMSLDSCPSSPLFVILVWYLFICGDRGGRSCCRRCRIVAGVVVVMCGSCVSNRRRWLWL